MLAIVNAFLEENRLPGVEIGILSEATRGHGLGFSGTMSAALATALFVMAKKCSKSDLESDGFEKTAAFREIFALASEMTRKLRYENSLGSNIAAGLMKGNLFSIEPIAETEGDDGKPAVPATFLPYEKKFDGI